MTDETLFTAKQIRPVAGERDCDPQLSVIEAMKSAAAVVITPAAIAAAKCAAAVMAVNKVYYRFVHLASNPEYKAMPVRLRANVVANPVVDRVNFKWWSQAVFPANGCGGCMDAREKTLREAGISSAVVQTAVRFATIVQSVAVGIEATARSVSGVIHHFFAVGQRASISYARPETQVSVGVGRHRPDMGGIGADRSRSAATRGNRFRFFYDRLGGLGAVVPIRRARRAHPSTEKGRLACRAGVREKDPRSDKPDERVPALSDQGGWRTRQARRRRAI